jgi:3'-phosphoadenosine 5'-phosphosulfate sulfotransferase (PAPS reductase)/FAD synthetase
MTRSSARARKNDRPALRLLSLGAGVQSTTVLLLACDGEIPKFDYALFADTRWEPKAVYAQLAKVRHIAKRAGIPVLTVSAGHIRRDAVDAEHRFVTMPLHVRNPDGSKGMARRQCTGEYKIKPLKAAARALLGYPHPTRVPTGVYAEQAIGISTDEFHRAKDSDVRYLRNVFPLLEVGMSRQDCLAYLADRGFGETVKSACIGCPFSGNSRLRWIRDTDPDAWADLIAFDREIRHGSPRAIAEGKPLRGQFFVHRSLKPLDQVDFDPLRRGHLRVVGDSGAEDDDPDGCSPWSCRSGQPITEERAA